MYLRITLLIFISAFCFSCKKAERLTPDELRTYLDNKTHGLIQHVNANGVEFILKYKPLEFSAFQELSNEEFSQSKLEETKKKYIGLEYFTLNISSEKMKIGDMIGFDEKKGRQDSIASYVHFYMQKDFQMINGSDTSHCVLYHLEQSGNIAPYLSISLAFEKLKSEEDEVKVLYEDKIFGTSNLTFIFSKKNLQNIPSLKLKS